MKIGEIVSASVLEGLMAKLQIPDPEELRIAYPVIVEGELYDFYCLVEDILNEESEIARQLAGSAISDVVLPQGQSDESYSGPIFYSMAKLRPIQLINKETGKLSEPQTIPPYFSQCRYATKSDVDLIYEITEKSAPVGTISGVERFYVHLDFGRLVEKPFAIYGRTGTGKSILNKLICCGILATGAGSVLLFDMHSEYGVYSKTDNTFGLKYWYPDRVEIFSLDPKNKEAYPFTLDPAEIDPEDLIVALQDLSPPTVDALYAVDKRRGSRDLVTAIREMTPEDLGEETAHEMSLQALKRRIARLDRLPFFSRAGKDSFNQMVSMIKDGRSVVLDFGDFGNDHTTYLFVANIISRRLYHLYTERNAEFPRLILFLEEAHKFLDPEIADEAPTFKKLAREMRKFNLILALVDQRPARISDEVRSQLANRFVMSLKEPNDVEAALAGVPDKEMWKNILSKIPLRTVAVMGDAIRIPTVIDVMEYNEENVQDRIVGHERMTTDRLAKIASRADEVFGT